MSVKALYSRLFENIRTYPKEKIVSTLALYVPIDKNPKAVSLAASWDRSVYDLCSPIIRTLKKYDFRK